MSNRAWVTLATNDSYGLGALVLAHSLRRAASDYPAVVLITPSVTDAMRERLSAVFAEVITVDVLDSRDAAHLALLQRPELGITFTKIHCWSLTQYEKCVFLDADTLVVQNCDELFEREELSAAPDVGWPDCFNSGVFVFKPSKETFEQLIKFAQERGSFDGGDQGLLNSFFSDWARGDINKHLPFLYNVTSAAFYSYLPALKHYGQNLKIIHFIGLAKPWLQQFNWESRTVDAPEHLKGLLQLWWDLFVGQVHPQLDVSMVEVQDPTPELPPHDVRQHYAPVLDPESEFPWHHPDAQPKEDYHREEIDLEQFHDPWEIYRGQIPPNKDEASTHTFLGRVEDHEEMKKYAWEYQSSHQEYKPVQYSQESASYHHYQPDHSFQQHQHDGQETHTHYHQPEHHWESHSHDQHTHYHHQSDEHHWHREQHQHEHQDHIHQNYENPDHGQKHYSHDHHFDHSAYTSDHQTHHHHSHQPHYEQSDHHSGHTPYHHTEKHQHEYSDPISHSHTNHQVEQVHRVHIDHDSILNLRTLKGDHSEKATSEMMNGDISESESDYYEDIPPRHPYDGFYLRHRVTIDARGRKICSHEIPPTPSPSISPPPDFVECPPDLLTEGTTIENNDEEHSGVAGNLARVTPGASGSQREALDELTRRQGWEAGNIDYMGADSFENIWAKISQTLSQPRVSPPKQPSPPKEVSQEAAAAPVEAQTPAATEAPATAEVPPAAEPPAVEAVVEAPVTSQASAPAEAPKAPVAAEEPPKVDAPAAEAAVEASEPIPSAEIPVTVEAIAAVTSQEAPVDPSDIPVTVEAASAPGETPSEVPVSVETAATTEVAKDEPQKTETPALPPTPPVTPKSTPESTPVSESAPLVEPVIAQTEASVPATESASESAPQVESVDTPKEEVSVSASEPVSESASPKVESEIQKEEVSTPTSTLASEDAPTPIVEPVVPKKEEVSETASATASESAPQVEPVEPKQEEVSKPAAAPSLESAPKVEPVESQKEEVSVSESAPASEAASKVEAQKEEVSPASAPASESTPKVDTQKEEVPAPASEVVPTPKEETPAPVEAPVVPETPATPAPPSAAEPAATPEKPSSVPSPAAPTDSPPLANTPSKEEAPALPAAKSEERRKVGKLQLSPPVVADPLPTPDSELEDAASLAQSIIASELRTPTATAPEPAGPASPPLTPQDKRLSVEEPEVPTPPISLAQIGVKPAPKAKPTTAAQIESSLLAEKSEPAATPEQPVPADQPAPKKKVVKKVKKESAAGAGDAPVPPPRKKEKKPKEK